MKIKNYCELIKKFTGLYPYKEQQKAAKKLVKGNVVDMKTGEGKTLVCLLAALLAHDKGRKVYISTSNDYLSKRDYEYSKKLFESLGIKSVFFKDSVGGSKEAYERADIIYATGQTLIFDYLRGVKAEYDFIIIDEIDHILVESANHDFSVSAKSESKTLMPYSVFNMCLKLSDYLTVEEKTERIKKDDYLFDMQYGSDVIISYPTRTVEITDVGYQKLESLWGRLDPLFVETMIATLQAKYFFIRDIHYIVKDNKIELVDDGTGRVFEGGSTDISIQTAIEIKESVPFSSKELLSNTCSFGVFFKLFKTLTGLSGTTSYVPYDFNIIFAKKVVKIPTHFPCKRKEYYQYFKTNEDRNKAILEIIKTENPILMVADSDKHAKKLKELISGKGKNVYVLENANIENETAYLESIKAKETVLISSKIVGRGTDIDLPSKFEEGLTVILAERFFSEREERQIIGRTGRNGKAGTAYILTSFEDHIFDLEYKDKKLPTEKYVKKLQSRFEQKMFESRKHIHIRSKFFFDQNKAIEDKLLSFRSYEEITRFALEKEINDEPLRQECIKNLRLAMGNGYKLTKSHLNILYSIYDRKRPIFQQQFLTYNDQMAETMYQAIDFSFRCKEYVNTGRWIILDTVNNMLKIMEERNGRNANRKKEIHP